MQTNRYDCGVFACRIIFYLARSARSFPFGQDDMSDLRERTVLEINDPRLLRA
jgi:Ulp1 family protease